MSFDRSKLSWYGLFAGPLLFLLTYLVLPESYTAAAGDVQSFSHAGRISLCVGVWMAAWWLTEAIDVSATALLPIALFPIFGAADIKTTTAPYAHHLIFLFMGGFLLSLSMQRWGLHKRIALFTVRLVGTRPRNMVGGFMLASAALSMWVSNTATALMMLPIALSVLEIAVPEGGEDRNMSVAMMLGIAYACSIGGIGTIIGTPPNLFLVSFIKDNLHHEISFSRWLMVGVPFVVVFLPLTWILLTRLIYPVSGDHIPGAKEATRAAYEALGPMNRGERATFIVFLVTASAWVFRPLLAKIEIAGLLPFSGLTDTGIAIFGALILFVIPTGGEGRGFVMDWNTAKSLPFGILILFGGGLSLAAALDKNQVGPFLAAGVSGLSGLPGPVLVMAVVALVIFLTELTSNTATTAALVPILSGVAPALGLHPFALIVPAAIAASCAFMMPVATPPNAIVFGSGFVTIPQMSRAGIWLNVAGIVLITLLSYLIFLPVLGAPSLGGP